MDLKANYVVMFGAAYSCEFVRASEALSFARQAHTAGYKVQIVDYEAVAIADHEHEAR